MRYVCLLVVFMLATLGPTGVIGQDQPPFLDETQRTLPRFTLALDPSGVAGQELSSGNELLPRCLQALGEHAGPRDTSAASECRSLVRGVLDMTRLTPSLQVCGTADVTVIQAVRVVVTYLNDHPEERDEPDTTLTLRALQRAFPCP